MRVGNKIALGRSWNWVFGRWKFSREDKTYFKESLRDLNFSEDTNVRYVTPCQFVIGFWSLGSVDALVDVGNAVTVSWDKSKHHVGSSVCTSQLYVYAGRRIDWPGFKVKSGTSARQLELYVCYLRNVGIDTTSVYCDGCGRCGPPHKFGTILRLVSSRILPFHVSVVLSMSLGLPLSYLKYVRISGTAVSWPLCHVLIWRVFRFHVTCSVFPVPFVIPCVGARFNHTLTF